MWVFTSNRVCITAWHWVVRQESWAHLRLPAPAPSSAGDSIRSSELKGRLNFDSAESGTFRRVIVLLLFWLGIAIPNAPLAAALAGTTTSAVSQLKPADALETFDAAWNTIQETHYDPTFG